MDGIFEDLISEGVVVVYLDDILIFTKTLEEHGKVVCQVMEILQKYSLSLKPEKCKFKKTSVEYLGVVISHDSVKMDPAKSWNGQLHLIKRKSNHSWDSPTSIGGS